MTTTTEASPSPSPGSATAGFVHLHVHTEHSKQDGLARVKDLAKRVAAMGTPAGLDKPATAMTDHGTIAGAWKFHQACKEAKIKPIMGVEAYMALAYGPDTFIEVDPPAGTGSTAKIRVPAPEMAWDDPQVRFTKMHRMEPDAESGKIKKNSNNHLTLLARTEQGWRNLCAIMNSAQQSIYHKPLIDFALLKKYSEGIIILTGCLGGPVASRVSMANAALREVGLKAQGFDVITNPDDPNGLVWRRKSGGDRAVAAARSEAWKKNRTVPTAQALDHARAQAEEAAAAATDEEVAAARTAHSELIDLARTNLDHLIECVGAENVYVEIMEHGLEAEGKDHIRTLTALADAAGVKVVATNDSHYVDCDEHEHHDEWLFAGDLARDKTGKAHLDDPDRWTFNGTGYHLRTEAEMRSIYAGKRWQEACDNTVELAARIDDEVLPIKALRLPVFPVPANVVAEWEAGEPATTKDIEGKDTPARRVSGKVYRTPSDYLLHQHVVAGAKIKYGTFTPELKERLRFEEDTVSALGLPDYFLIVEDVIDWARSDRGYPTAKFPLGEPGQKKPIQVGPGRGSAAGSAMAYATDITRVEPLTGGLLFERFLDIERVGMPDIDVDFEQGRRDEIYIYLGYRYGQENIARIGAFQGVKSKRAIKDAARIHGLPVNQHQKLADLIPMDGATPMTFAQIFEEERDKDTGQIIACPKGREFRELIAGNPNMTKVLATARSFENVVAGETIHAAGVIISDEPLFDMLPMRWQKAKDSDDIVPIVMWDGVDCDDFGLLKLDALGLVNLDYLAACLDNIEATTGVVIDPYVDIPHPDTIGDPMISKSFSLIRAGRTQAIFQLASPGMTKLTVDVAPTGFDDLSAIIALFRPGPMGADMHNIYARRKNGRETVDYGIFTDDPIEQAVIEKSLGDTFGVIVYQEQLMDLGLRVAGFDAAQRSLLRKAVSKKKKEMVDKSKTAFMEQGVREITLPDGTISPAFSVETLETLWVTFDKSAKYLFNKSHTWAYGYLAYLTAYLKANYPTEYTAAVLAVETKDDRRLAIIGDALDEGIDVLPPDVNLSGYKTMPDPVTKGAIRFGLGEIRDVKSNAKEIITARADGPFESLGDLLSRTKDADGKLLVPANAVEGLIEAGALDTFGKRLGHMTVARAVTVVPELEVPDAEWGALERANRQRHRLGFTVGENPLVTYKAIIDDYKSGYTIDMDTGEDSSLIQPKTVDEALRSQASHGNVVGLLTGWSERITRGGDRMANFTMEGVTSRVEGVVFPMAYKAWAQRNAIPAPGTMVAITGKLERKTFTLDTTGDGEDGDGVAEEMEKIELYGDRAVTIRVPNAPRYDLSDLPGDTFDYAYQVGRARFLSNRGDADAIYDTPAPPVEMDAKRSTRPAKKTTEPTDPDYKAPVVPFVPKARPSTPSDVALVTANTSDKIVVTEGFGGLFEDERKTFFNAQAGQDGGEDGEDPILMITDYRNSIGARSPRPQAAVIRVHASCHREDHDRAEVKKHPDKDDLCPQCPTNYFYAVITFNRKLVKELHGRVAASYLTVKDLPTEKWQSAHLLDGKKPAAGRVHFYCYTPDEVRSAHTEHEAHIEHETTVSGRARKQ